MLHRTVTCPNHSQAQRHCICCVAVLQQRQQMPLTLFTSCHSWYDKAKHMQTVQHNPQQDHLMHVTRHAELCPSGSLITALYYSSAECFCPHLLAHTEALCNADPCTELCVARFAACYAQRAIICRPDYSEQTTQLANKHACKQPTLLRANNTWTIWQGYADIMQKQPPTQSSRISSIGWHCVRLCHCPTKTCQGCTPAQQHRHCSPNKATPPAVRAQTRALECPACNSQSMHVCTHMPGMCQQLDLCSPCHHWDLM